MTTAEAIQRVFEELCSRPSPERVTELWRQFEELVKEKQKTDSRKA